MPRSSREAVSRGATKSASAGSPRPRPCPPAVAACGACPAVGTRLVAKISTSSPTACREEAVGRARLQVRRRAGARARLPLVEQLSARLPSRVLEDARVGPRSSDREDGVQSISSATSRNGIASSRRAPWKHGRGGWQAVQSTGVRLRRASARLSSRSSERRFSCSRRSVLLARFSRRKPRSPSFRRPTTRPPARHPARAPPAPRMRSDPHRGVRRAGGGPADQQRQAAARAFELARHVHHLLERGVISPDSRSRSAPCSRAAARIRSAGTITPRSITS